MNEVYMAVPFALPVLDLEGGSSNFTESEITI